MKKILKALKKPSLIGLYILNFKVFRILPDWFYLKLQYWLRLGKSLDLNNPKSFTEKLQWLKLYNRDPKYEQLVDKFRVRNYVGKVIGKEYLIPLIGTWDNWEQIDFNKLPEEFVLKSTHDSGGVVVCNNKQQLDVDKAREKMNNSLNKNYYYHGREWVYKRIKPRIIGEKKLNGLATTLNDYKIMCFNGKPKIIQVMTERKGNDFFINHFDIKWNEVYIPRKTKKRNTDVPEKPKDLETMVKISEILSKGITFVRIDMYETKEGIYFGEFTFFPVSGYMDFFEEKDDQLLGSWLALPEKR